VGCNLHVVCQCQLDISGSLHNDRFDSYISSLQNLSIFPETDRLHLLFWHHFSFDIKRQNKISLLCLRGRKIALLRYGMKIQRVTWHWQVGVSRINHLNHKFCKKAHLKIDKPLTLVPGSAIAYGLDGPGTNPGGGEIFRTCLDRPWGPAILLYKVYRVFPGGKVRPGRDADPSPPSSAEVKNRAIHLLSLRAFVAYERVKPT